jgi:hypothetical protein
VIWPRTKSLLASIAIKMKEITNKHFKRNELLEKYLYCWNWLQDELPGPGGKCIK